MWSGMPKVPPEAYLPNISGVAEQFWSIWLQEICLWTPHSHCLVDDMGMTSNA
jgi:hypothetical protein